MAQEYNVLLKRVSTLEDCVNVLKLMASHYKIIHLEIGGHGTSTSINLGLSTLRVGRDRDKLASLFSYIDPHAQILTISCNNGKRIRGDNMLTYLAKIARGHRVMGTVCENGSHLELKVESARPLKLTYTYRGEDVTAFEYYD